MVDDKYKILADKIRIDVLNMTHDAHCSHVGSCLSIADILAVLYGGILNIRPKEPKWDGRDRFILSKGHACAALYATLAESGFFVKEVLKTFYHSGYHLEGHANHNVPGVDVSTGSLGNGLSIGCGMALAKQKVYVLLGDGDLNEGSTWEAIMFAGQHRLSNLVAIIDYNCLQALGKSEDILSMTPLMSKWVAFGWDVCQANGHNHVELVKGLTNLSYDKPNCLIAYTVKGKGVSFMKDKFEWHYKCPNDDELKLALKEI